MTRPWTSACLAAAVALASGTVEAKAPAGRYVVQAVAGTVHDTATKLTWQRDGTAAGPKNWADAMAYCKGLALDGGGWRLPGIVELRSLLDRSEAGPYIDATAFPNTPPEWYWSASKPPWAEKSAWWIHFGTTEAFGDMSTSVGRVRCVR